MTSTRHRQEDGSAGPEGRILKMPVRLEPESFSPVLFVERALEEGLVDVALKVEYEVIPDLDWSLQFSFRRTATTRGSRSGIESVEEAFYPVHYLPGRLETGLPVPRDDGPVVRGKGVLDPVVLAASLARPRLPVRRAHPGGPGEPARVVSPPRCVRRPAFRARRYHREDRRPAGPREAEVG